MTASNLSRRIAFVCTIDRSCCFVERFLSTSIFVEIPLEGHSARGGCERESRITSTVLFLAAYLAPRCSVPASRDAFLWGSLWNMV